MAAREPAAAAAAKMERVEAAAEAAAEIERAAVAPKAAAASAASAPRGREGCGRGRRACGRRQHRETLRSCADAWCMLTVGPPRS